MAEPSTLPVGKREHIAQATRAALIDAAEALFTDHGYAATSLDAIAARADVTKGALYHHFSGKQAVFEAVFEKVEGGSARAIEDSLLGHDDPWDKARAGLRTYLLAVQRPAHRRIVIQDGPAVLGFARFREQEERGTYGIVVEIVGSVLNLGHWHADDALARTFTRTFFGALSAAGEGVAESVDPTAESARVEAAVGMILDGLRSLYDGGAALPTTS